MKTNKALIIINEFNEWEKELIKDVLIEEFEDEYKLDILETENISDISNKVIIEIINKAKKLKPTKLINLFSVVVKSKEVNDISQYDFIRVVISNQEKTIELMIAVDVDKSKPMTTLLVGVTHNYRPRP